MNSIEILLHLRCGEQPYNRTDHGYWFISHHFKNYCSNHHFINGVCPNCCYTEDGEPLAYLREKEIENANL